MRHRKAVECHGGWLGARGVLRTATRSSSSKPRARSGVPETRSQLETGARQKEKIDLFSFARTCLSKLSENQSASDGGKAEREAFSQGSEQKDHQKLTQQSKKMEDAPMLFKNPKSECPDFWIRLPRHMWPTS